jgi:hypothetical protein
LLAVAAIVWAAIYHPFIDTPRVFDDDARHHVYWTYKFRDRELFRDDLLTDFMSSPRWAPYGYRALYFVGAHLMDPLLFSQILSLLLASVAAVLLFKIGTRIGGRRGSTFASLLFVLFFLYSSSGGFPRSFAFPLLLGFVYLLMRDSSWGMACLLLCQSLLYPPILLNALALGAFTWGRTWRQGARAKIWRDLVSLGVGVALAGGILLSVYAASPRASFGEVISRHEARTMPEFSAQGRTPFYGDTFLRTALNGRAGIAANRLYGFGLVILAMFVVLGPSKFVVPRLVKDLVLTSVGPFVLAHLLLFRLHNPSRYVLYTFPLAAMLVIAANFQDTLATLYERWPALFRCSLKLKKHRGLGWVAIGCMALVFVYAQNRYFVVQHPLQIRVGGAAMRLYRYLQNLPKDVLIAGHPAEMDNIPLLSRRKVLVNKELSLPYYTKYYAEIRRRIRDSLAAYYAAREQQVRRFVRRYGVHYILVNKRHFTPQFLRGPIYYEPFNSIMKKRLATQHRFALLEGRVGKRVYEDGPYVLLSFVGAEKERTRGQGAH